MEWEALLFGIEPVVALGVGVAAIVLAPLIGAVAKPEVGETISNTTREVAKNGLKFGIESYENLQSSLSGVSQSWNDLVADAKAEVELSRNGNNEPRTVNIVEEN